MDDSHPLDYYPEDDTGDDLTDSLALIDRARSALAQAKNLADIGAVREIAERARRYASAAKLGRDAENHAARLRIEAERKAGALLADAPKHPAGRPSENRSDDPTDFPPKLSDLGISKQQSSDWQRIARVPNDVFTAHVEQVQRKGEGLTTSGVVQIARQIERKEREAEPKAVIAPATIPARIEVADALVMPLARETVHLIVTSPQYGVGIDYDGLEDMPPGHWEAFIQKFCMEALRVATQGGRLALNIPLDTTKGGFRPTYSQAVACAQRAGWTYRSTIVWDKSQLGKSTARGSLDSASAPSIIAPVEMIPLFSKGPWGRIVDGESDLTRDEWLDWTNGLWPISPQQRGWEAHPVPFPLELPRRLIKLLSFPGDVVLDPFLGSGTTALAALQLGRQAIGFDRSQTYVESTLRRLAADRERPGAVGAARAGESVRASRAPEVLAGGLRGRLHRGAGGPVVVEQFQGGQAGVAVS